MMFKTNLMFCNVVDSIISLNLRIWYNNIFIKILKNKYVLVDSESVG